VSVKLIPQICINKAYNSRRLTVRGRWAAAPDRHSQSCLQTFVCLFVLFCLFSSFDKTTTELGLDAEGLTETVLHLNLEFICFVVFLFFVCLFALFYSPLRQRQRQRQNFFPDTNTRTRGWRINTKIIKTETLLHLNMGIVFSFFLFLFYYPLSV
jgi:hypothetical protein